MPTLGTNLRGIDLNLLVVLDALLRDTNVTRACRKRAPSSALALAFQLASPRWNVGCAPAKASPYASIVAGLVVASPGRVGARAQLGFCHAPGPGAAA